MNLLLLLLLFQAETKSEWQKIDLKSFAWLRSIYFVDQNYGFIVGNKGVFFETLNGGENWYPKTIASEDDILDVYFLDRQTGWLLCERNRFHFPSLSPSYILKTSDGGLSWQKIEIEGEKRRLSKFAESKNGNLLIVGESGALYELSEGKLTKIQIPTFYRLTDGFLAEDLIFVVGGSGLILFSEDLQSWQKPLFNIATQDRFNSVFFLDKRLGWAVGNQGQIYFTQNGGKLWLKQESQVTENLNDVLFVNRSKGFIVGDNGLILKTENLFSWEKVKVPTSNKLERLYYNGKKVFAIGFGGTLLQLNF